MAVPLKVQKSGFSCFEGKSIDKMKLVDYPVVDNTPTLFDVL